MIEREAVYNTLWSLMFMCVHLCEFSFTPNSSAQFRQQLPCLSSLVDKTCFEGDYFESLRRTFSRREKTTHVSRSSRAIIMTENLSSVFLQRSRTFFYYHSIKHYGKEDASSTAVVCPQEAHIYRWHSQTKCFH